MRNNFLCLWLVVFVLPWMALGCVSTPVETANPSPATQEGISERLALIGEPKYAKGQVTNTFLGQTWDEVLQLYEVGNNSLAILFQSNLPDNPFLVYMDKYGLEHKYQNVKVEGKTLIVRGLSLDRLFEDHEPSLFIAVMDITNRNAMWNCSFQFLE